jgi:hypothetical protein
VDYPANYTLLAGYALNLINVDRQTNGLSNVTLSPITSGQQHADSMDYYGTYGHWDVQGYKPYMRYTLLGGTGAVDENVALNFCRATSNPSDIQVVACNVQTVENAINQSEWAMLNNDSICCGNGHREDILEPLHNRVSIGIAYNTSSDVVFFVEDFENYYLGFNSVSLSNGLVSLNASVDSSTVSLTPWVRNANGSLSSGSFFAVYYDPVPAAITTLPTVSCLIQGNACQAYAQCASQNELNETTACTYWGGYGPGNFVTEVFGPCPRGYECSSQLEGGAVATFAKTWEASEGTFEVQFSLSAFMQQGGSGVYTLYLVPQGSNDSLTSYSLFVS